ncbi:uncharacterized protein LOC126203834 isoform X2 [Schistocerca nitens]|uniref:uncharacterized protein LOC126203834 isoform X2 n=1 Tax=Schistocerca nitens TaxID=7011 RepID=UPI002117A9FE|nr:uncharacterized protein LOC126203834 isoform X2 [Schistocerca nitens]
MITNKIFHLHLNQYNPCWNMQETLIGTNEESDLRTRGNKTALCTRVHFFMKITELVFACLAAGLLSEAEDITNTILKTEIVHGTTIGFIMINGLIVFAELTQPIGKAPMVLSSVFGCIMFITSGVCLLQVRKTIGAVCAGIISILEGVLFFSDIFVVWCYREDVKIQWSRQSLRSRAVFV